MESYFEKRVNKLYQQVNKLIDSAEMYKAKRNGEKFQPEITKEFKEDFFKLVDKVILRKTRIIFMDIFYFKWEEK